MTNPQHFDPTKFDRDLEKKLKRCFDRIGTGTIGKAFEGAVRILADEGNPYRYVQAGHSIRQVTNLLAREISRESVENNVTSEPKSNIDVIFDEIRKAVDKAVELVPCNDEASKNEQSILASQRLEELLKGIASGKISMKQKLKSLFGTKDDFEKMTQQAKEAVRIVLNIWGKCHDYFNGVSKGDGKVDENAFRENWFQIQDCWWSACCIFIEAMPEIDEAIAMGPPQP